MTFQSFQLTPDSVAGCSLLLMSTASIGVSLGNAMMNAGMLAMSNSTTTMTVIIIPKCQSLMPCRSDSVVERRGSDVVRQTCSPSWLQMDCGICGGLSTFWQELLQSKVNRQMQTVDTEPAATIFMDQYSEYKLGIVGNLLLRII